MVTRPPMLGACRNSASSLTEPAVGLAPLGCCWADAGADQPMQAATAKTAINLPTSVNLRAMNSILCCVS
jgi:hypothetical protein